MRVRIIGAIVSIVLAAVGTVLLLNYVRAADVRASQGAEFVPVYMVVSEVPAGTTGSAIAEYLEIKEIPALAAVDGRVTNLADIEDLVTDVALQPGEQLLSTRWINPDEAVARGEVALPEGMQAVTIALQVERVVGGAITGGDRVGVVVSAEAEIVATGETRYLTTQSFHKVLVLSVQPGSAFLPEDGETEGAAAPVEVLMVTLASTTPDIEAIIWAQEWGKIWLTLEPEGATVDGGRTVDGNILFQ